MADLQRATFAGNHRRRENAPSLVPNLLVTTLAVVAGIALPVGASHEMPDTSLHPARARHLNADTSRGSPLALIAPAVAQSPLTQALHLAAQDRRTRGYVGVDTTQDTAGMLLEALTVNVASAMPESLPPQRFPLGLTNTSFRNVAALDVAAPPVLPQPWASLQHKGVRGQLGTDSTADTPLALLGITPAPFLIEPLGAPDWRRTVVDTSEGTPKPLFDDAIAPPGRASHVATPSPLRVVDDTSISIPKTLTFDPAASPFFNPQHTAPDRLRPVVDTSRGIPKVLTFDPAPVFNLQHTAPDRPRPVWDTSRGTPKTLFSDAQQPCNVLPQSVVDRLRPVADTSQSTRIALPQVAAPAPLVNVPWSGVQRPRDVYALPLVLIPAYQPVGPVVVTVNGRRSKPNTSTLARPAQRSTLRRK